MIIQRYLSKEVIHTLLGVTSVLLLIFLSNQLVRFLSYAASGKLATHVLLQLLGFEIPYLLSLLLPLGLYLGIILAYSRLYAESEMTVLHSSGFGVNQLFKVTLGFSSLVVLAVVVLTFWLNPLIAAKKSTLMTESMAQENIIDTLMPGRFRVSNNGHRVIYVEKVSSDRTEARNIFIAEQQKTQSDSGAATLRWTVVSAAQGGQMKDKKTGDRFVVANQGYRYEGTPGENDYKIIQFKQYAVRIPPILQTKRQAQEAIATPALFAHYQDPSYAAELQWRFAMPISALLLALLAVPLSYVKPRAGRYAQLLPAILIYVIYVNLLFMARNWVEQKTLSIHLGLWWVHGLIAVLLMGIIFFHRNRYRRLIRKRS